MEKPDKHTLQSVVGLSKSYSFEIANGTRTPSRPLAIKIYRATGWRFPPIDALTDAQIDVIESIDCPPST